LGLVNFGIPKKETEFLKKSMKLEIFIEGGTYKGETTREMSKKFRKVYTIEKSNVMFDIAKDNLKNLDNVTMLNGDTREHLDSIMKSNDNLLFWLDAHWSGGETYGKEDECPLIEELEIIFKYDKNCIILIDDARLFLAPPPKPHNFKNWQSLIDIVNILPTNWDLIEYEDVIYLFPKTISIDFKEFIQDDITDKMNKQKYSFVQKILKKLGIVNC
jgi:16S rRNA G966 N2-methylase RsmD